MSTIAPVSLPTSDLRRTRSLSTRRVGPLVPTRCFLGNCLLWPMNREGFEPVLASHSKNRECAKWDVVYDNDPSWPAALHVDKWSVAQFVARKGVLATDHINALAKEDVSEPDRKHFSADFRWISACSTWTPLYLGNLLVAVWPSRERLLDELWGDPSRTAPSATTPCEPPPGPRLVT